MPTLVLLRHGESDWNRENRFTGWTDVDLSEQGREEARAGGRTLRERGFTFDVAFTSVLKRAIRTLWIVLDEMDATRKALDRSRQGDLVVLCADYASEVWKELETRRSLAQPPLIPAILGDGQSSTVGGDPDVFEFESSSQ